MRRSAFLTACLCFFAVPGFVRAGEAPMPRYDHIFVIILENKSFDQIVANKAAPTLNGLAKTYGVATHFFAEVHPSEGNYVAMLGGSNFGIHDDDPYWCKPGSTDKACRKATAADYVDHTVTARSLVDQLHERNIAWKGYFEDIPEPGSMVDRSPEDAATNRPFSLYAVKHNGFMTYRSVQDDPKRAARIVGFDALQRDIAANDLPAFAHIVPNQCNDMHGLAAVTVQPPPDCVKDNMDGLIARADNTVGHLVEALMATKAWSGPGNVVIVITFDEGGHDSPGARDAGCCGAEAGEGGGQIATLVLTNHGPRGVSDPTPYNHYSLLRSIEAAFGINDYLGRAADVAKGVVVMAPLFAVPGR